MAILFTVEEGIAKPHEETLLIEPFKTIWKRDKHRKKVNAIQEFTYIEFMTSKLATNPYRGYDAATRSLKLKEEFIKIENWKEDNLIKMGMEVLHEFQTNASLDYGMYVDAEFAAQKLRIFFRTFDINERTEKGIPIYKPKEITAALQDVDRTITSLDALKKKVEEQLYEVTKTRAQKVVSPFADPTSLIG